MVGMDYTLYDPHVIELTEENEWDDAARELILRVRRDGTTPALEAEYSLLLKTGGRYGSQRFRELAEKWK